MDLLRLLLVEDSINDAELLLRHLQLNNCNIQHHRVDNRHDMQEALRDNEWDLIISDYTMPGFSGLEALKIAKQEFPDIPFIIVSGNIGEDIAAAAMVAGAQDYVMKGNLARLLPAIERELKEAQLRIELNRTKNILDNLSCSTYGVTGQDFFYALSETIGMSLGMRYVLIGEFTGLKSDKVQTLSVWHDNRYLDNFLYSTKDLPCAVTAHGEAVILQDLPQDTYPGLIIPVDIDVHGYVSFPLIDTRGNVVGLIVVLTDVVFDRTELVEYVLQFSASRAAAEIERSKAETKLRKSEEYLRGILDNIQDIIYRTGPDGCIDYVSPSVSKLLGYRQDELMGKQLADLYIEKNDRDIFLHALNEGHGNIFNYEVPLRHSDGSVVWVSTNAHYLYDPGTGAVTGVEGITRDITARKLTEKALRESEELFSKAFHYSPAMISISEFSEDFSSGHFLKVNESFLKAIDYQRDQVIGYSFADINLFAYEDQRDKLVQLLRNQGQISEIELSFRARSGEVRYGLGSIELFEINAAPCVLIVCLDITERKQANEELSRYREQLEENVSARTMALTNVVADLESEILERKRIETALIDAMYQAEQANLAKTEFLANMSHELRTPLNSIIGFSELLMIEPKDVINNECRQKLGYITDSAWHLLTLINDILDLSKIEAGKLGFEPGMLNIHNMLESTMIMLRGKATNSIVNLSSEIEPGILKIVADGRKLKQILSNLIGNAIKFCNKNGNVHVQVTRAAKADFKRHCGLAGQNEPDLSDFILFSVEDDGIGIDDEDIGKLFMPFVQLDASLTRRYEGSGLGLHLCRQLVGLHGGCIWVESEPGKGSTFRFIIPCTPCD